jgi:hypothetical protein
MGERVRAHALKGKINIPKYTIHHKPYTLPLKIDFSKVLDLVRVLVFAGFYLRFNGAIFSAVGDVFVNSEAYVVNP